MSNVICVECNSEVPAGSELCPECGFPLEKSPDAVPCPECGNMVLFTEGVCPECGLPRELLDAPPEELAAEEEIEETQDPLEEQAAEPAPMPAVVVRRIETDGDLTDEVLKVQIEAFNEFSLAIARLVEQGGTGALKEMTARMASESAAAKNELLSDLINSIGKFVESSENIKNETLATLKEQNELTLNGMQEIVAKFGGEVQSATQGIKEAEKSAVAELNNLAQQVKASAVIAKEGAEAAGKGGGMGEYVLYICLVLVLFSSLNIIFTAYVVKLLRITE